MYCTTYITQSQDCSVKFPANNLLNTAKVMPLLLPHSSVQSVLHCLPLQLHSGRLSRHSSCRTSLSPAQPARHSSRANGSLTPPLQKHAAPRCKGRSSRAATVRAAASDNQSLKVGFLGLGIMGTAMVQQSCLLCLLGIHERLWQACMQVCFGITVVRIRMSEMTHRSFAYKLLRGMQLYKVGIAVDYQDSNMHSSPCRRGICSRQATVSQSGIALLRSARNWSRRVPA